MSPKMTHTFRIRNTPIKLERKSDIETTHVIVSCPAPTMRTPNVNTFWIRDDMPLDVQRDMLDDAQWEMYGDLANTSDVDDLVAHIRTFNATHGVVH